MADSSLVQPRQNDHILVRAVSALLFYDSQSHPVILLSFKSRLLMQVAYSADISLSVGIVLDSV